MLIGFQHLHSALRWVVLGLLLFTLIRAIFGWVTNRKFEPFQAKAGLFTMISLHVQLILGLVLYFGKGWSSMLGEAEAMSNAVMRFFILEHVLGMIAAVVLGTLGHRFVKRATSSQKKNGIQSIYFGLALIIILVSIPWPIRPGFEAYGWF